MLVGTMTEGIAVFAWFGCTATPASVHLPAALKMPRSGHRVVLDWLNKYSGA